MLAATFTGGPTLMELASEEVLIDHLSGHQLAIVDLKVTLTDSKSRLPEPVAKAGSDSLACFNC